jgi:site-specific DNA-methyltransferase (adenine-specific)
MVMVNLLRRLRGRILSDINLMQGDCLERMKEIPDGSVDMILTDPPYGTTACKWDSIIPLEPMWEQLKRVVKPNGAIVMTASQPFTTTLISSNMKMFKYCLVWEKSRSSSPMLAKKQPMRFHEDICIFYKKQPSYNPIMTEGEKNHGTKSGRAIINIHGGIESNFKANTSNMKYPRSVIKIKSTDSTRNLHPTQKPVALMEYLIRTYTNENETVLDFTMGSGSTGVACVNTNRNFIGIELDAGYFEIAKERINNA